MHEDSGIWCFSNRFDLGIPALFRRPLFGPVARRRKDYYGVQAVQNEKRGALLFVELLLYQFGIVLNVFQFAEQGLLPLSYFVSPLLKGNFRFF